MNKPYSSTILVLCSIILMGLGLYFVFLRAPLLPEDLRYMDASLAEIQAAAPGLLKWLQKVFWVLGGYSFTSGLLTLYVAITAFRARASGAVWVVAAAGLTSIGWMVVVNFIIGSDFKWLLLSFALLWGIALLLFGMERRNRWV
jgi:hypothetical protein